jgi:hypothetical protein
LDHLCGRLGYRCGRLALVPVCICPPRFEALNVKAMHKQAIPSQWPSIVVYACVAIVAAGALTLLGWIALALMGY